MWNGQVSDGEIWPILGHNLDLCNVINYKLEVANVWGLLTTCHICLNVDLGIWHLKAHL